MHQSTIRSLVSDRTLEMKLSRSFSTLQDHGVLASIEKGQKYLEDGGDHSISLHVVFTFPLLRYKVNQNVQGIHGGKCILKSTEQFL